MARSRQPRGQSSTNPEERLSPGPKAKVAYQGRKRISNASAAMRTDGQVLARLQVLQGYLSAADDECIKRRLDALHPFFPTDDLRPLQMGTNVTSESSSCSERTVVKSLRPASVATADALPPVSCHLEWSLQESHIEVNVAVREVTASTR